MSLNDAYGRSAFETTQSSPRYCSTRFRTNGTRGLRCSPSSPSSRPSDRWRQRSDTRLRILRCSSDEPGVALIGSWLAGDVYHFHGQGWVLSVTATVLNRDKQHHPPPERVQGQRRLQALPPTATYTTRLQALSHQGSFFSHSSNNMSAWFHL